jgi:hypothetical protein
MGNFLSDTFFKYFSIKYVYIEAATMTPHRVVFFCSSHPESIATLPPFSLIEGYKWLFQISSQLEAQKIRFAFIQSYLPAL